MSNPGLPPTNSLSFTSVSTDTYDTVLSWLKKPHVIEHFHGEGLKNTLEDLQKYVHGDSPEWKHWIARVDDVPFGYLITSDIANNDAEDPRLTKHLLDGDTAITLDVLIGPEEFLGRGLAPKMIREFLVGTFGTISVVFIDPEASNARAIHVYEKVGFRKYEQFIAPWNPVPHWQMIVRMDQLK